MNTGNFTGATFVFTTSYKELTGLSTSFVLASPSQDFAMTTDGRLEYTGIKTKTFSIDATFTIASNSLGNEAIELYKNGTATGIACFVGDINTLTLNGVPVSLSTNDYVSLFAKSSTNLTVNIYSVTIVATSMEGD
jgi:hypothetical protein